MAQVGRLLGQLVTVSYIMALRLPILQISGNGHREMAVQSTH